MVVEDQVYNDHHYYLLMDLKDQQNVSMNYHMMEMQIQNYNELTFSKKIK